jgi:hypothetical protein
MTENKKEGGVASDVEQIKLKRSGIGCVLRSIPSLSRLCFVRPTKWPRQRLLARPLGADHPHLADALLLGDYSYLAQRRTLVYTGKVIEDSTVYQPPAVERRRSARSGHLHHFILRNQSSCRDGSARLRLS